VLDALNDRPMRKLGASRRGFFTTIDQPALLPLPAEPHRYAEWRKCRVAPDDHIELHGHFYWVPFRLIRQVLDARLTDTTIELFHQGKRVAAHPRSPAKRHPTTIPDHLPSAHRRYASRTPANIAGFAAEIGPAAAALVETIMRAKPHPEQDFRACLGILRLARAYGTVRREAACRRGLSIGATSCGSIASILKNGFDRAFHEEAAAEAEPLRHANIRGQGCHHRAREIRCSPIDASGIDPVPPGSRARARQAHPRASAGAGPDRHVSFADISPRDRASAMAQAFDEQRRDLVEIMDDRHDRGSTIVTSQLPVEHWHEQIGDPTLS
jgi:transposase